MLVFYLHKEKLIKRKKFLTKIKKSDKLIMFLRGCGEMADTLDLGSSAERRGGSSPFIRTILRLNMIV